MEKKRLILWIAIILTLAFIFGQSLLDKDTSKKQSTAVQEKIVEPVHKAITGENTIHYDIRDLAHTVEFIILGLELTLLLSNKKRILRCLKSVSYCGFVALLDETLQNYSGRAPELIDIWHDILGAVVGTVMVIILVLMANKVKLKDKV